MTATERPEPETSFYLAIAGLPAPKGSLKCVGTRGRHRLINTDADTQDWEDKVTGAAIARWQNAPPMMGPVVVEAVITLGRPRSLSAKDRPWPSKRSPGHGDIDKLGRTILDALTNAQVIGDDAQVVELVARKVYPDTPDVADAMAGPGAVVRVMAV